MRRMIILAGLGFISFSGCSTKTLEVSQSTPVEVTLSNPEKEIRVGMSQTDLGKSLGSPNIVTKDSDGHETWVYDKVASAASQSLDGKSVYLGSTKDANGSISSSKNITLVIKFDKNSNIAHMTFHTIKF